MLRKFKDIQKHLYWIIWGLVFFVLVSFASKKQEKRICNEVYYEIENQLGNYFIQDTDLEKLMTNGNKVALKGLSREAIDLHKLEAKILENKFVLEASIQQTLTGDVYVHVIENKPIARFFGQNNSFYVDERGKKLPLSRNYTARVMVVHATEFKEARQEAFFTTEEGKAFIDLLKFIDNDAFWKKQISEIEIDKKGRITMWPLIGKQEIRFGAAEDIRPKFQKLDIFFKKILPHVGWNKYKIVNLEFNNQIVCE